MKKIVVGASKPRKCKLLATLIMWWEDTPASHVYIYIQRSTGKKMVYHAVGAGTVFYGYENFLKINASVYEKEIEIENAMFDVIIDTHVRQ